MKPSKDFSLSRGIGIATAFELGQELGYSMTKFVSICAVGIKDNTTFGEECAEAVKERTSFIARQIIEEEKL